MLRNRSNVVFSEPYNPEHDTADDGPLPVHLKTPEQRETFKEIFKNCLLFKSLDLNQLERIVDVMYEKKINANEYVVRIGEEANKFYIIELGNFNVFAKNKNGELELASSCSGNTSFGEIALMYNMPSNYTIQAVTDGILWVLERQTFRRIVLKGTFQRYKTYENHISNVYIFGELRNKEKRTLAEALNQKVYVKGDVIYKRGDSSDGVYFIENGTVILKGETSPEDDIVLSSGDYFGESAFVRDGRRNMTALADAEAVKCAFLSVDTFERLLGPCEDIMKRNKETYQQNMDRVRDIKP